MDPAGHSADRIEDYVDMAFTAAVSGRQGPAVLLVSMDLLSQAEERPISLRKASCGHYPLDRVQPARVSVEAPAALRPGAQVAVIYASGGIIESGTQAELRALQQAAHLPVATRKTRS